MEAPSKYFLFSLTHHVKTHLAGFQSDLNLVPPYCGLLNHTTMQGVAVFDAFHSSEYP